MNGETIDFKETPAEEVLRLLEEIGQSGAQAAELRKSLKETLDSPKAVLGNADPTTGYFRFERIQALGSLVLDKTISEIDAKRIALENRTRLAELLMPKDTQPPIITVVSLSNQSITSGYNPEKPYSQGSREVLEKVTGSVIAMGEFQMQLMTQENKSYNIYPTCFQSGELQIAIESWQDIRVVH
jgi:hypothetical protein